MSRSTPARIESEAAHWAARLEGRGLTEADRADLAAWLAADPEHRWTLGRYRELSAQVAAHFEAEHEAAVIARHTSRAWRRWLAAGAAAAAIAGAAFVILNRSREFSTRAAERHAAVLEDGTHVELNARSAVAVDFGGATRRVRLLRGEALFTVARDTTRPFLVETPAGTVRVTGTTFNVRAADAHVEVTVLEGRVRVQPRAPDAAEASLTPGAQALLARDRADVREIGEAAARDTAAWRQGVAVFDGTPLREAVARFAAYHGRTITIEDAAGGARIGGRYALDDLEGFLESIERVLGVRVRREAGGTVRIMPAPAK